MTIPLIVPSCMRNHCFSLAKRRGSLMGGATKPVKSRRRADDGSGLSARITVAKERAVGCISGTPCNPESRGDGAPTFDCLWRGFAKSNAPRLPGRIGIHAAANVATTRGVSSSRTVGNN